VTRPIPQDIHRYPFDLIVVGAGINGAGIARDAAMRGLRTLLLDKGDIASGTTQWSTRLIHGGLRYLEHLEFALVRESLSERERLLRIAPHLVKPLPFLVPIYERSRRGPLMIRLGMIAYDLLSFDKSLPNHRMLSRDETLARAPGLDPDGLLAAAFYHDCQSEYAERLAVENVLSARDHGATALTYCEVTDLVIEEGEVRGVRFSDRLDGTEREARAPVTVNVAGPWVDEVLGARGPQRMIGGTKGSHIVVDPFPGAPRDALYVEAAADGRPYFIVPWNGRYLIGTTDERYEGDLDLITAEEAEISYLIAETNRVIPRSDLTRDDVLFTYSGVRPLPYAAEGAEGGITRNHIVHDHSESGGPDGLFSIVGGKLTTYRNLSEQTVNMVLDQLRLQSVPCQTGKLPLPGGTEDFLAFAAAFKAESGLTNVLSERLLRIYGVRAPDVLAGAGDDSSLKLPLSPRGEGGLIGAEVLYAFRHEMSETLADALLRRTMAGMGPRVGLDVAEPAAHIAAEYLGWSGERAAKEVAAYREYVRRYTPRNEHLAGAP
jgi:glycerol-3-phosphate dehydrogenase